MLSFAVRYDRGPKPSARGNHRAGLQGAPAGAGPLLELQRLAGNRAVADLVAQHPTRRPLAVAPCTIVAQRCGCDVHEGCACARDGTDDEVQRAAESTSSAGSPVGDAPPGTGDPPECPGLPDPHGEWMTEPWLCEMRAEPLYSNRRLLAPGARGRSVELLHRVLQDWICQKTADGDPPAHALADWRSGVHTQATSDVVRDFQDDVRATMREGIVGPETLSLLDGHVGGPDSARLPAECRPEPKDVPGDPCPPREPGEDTSSASDRLTIDKSTPRPAGPGAETQTLSLRGFTVDDASIDKGPSSTLDDLADMLDPGSSKPRTPGGGQVECWEVESATVFGFADCNEEPSVGRARAEAVATAVATRVPDAGPIVDQAPDSPAGNATADERRVNRSAVIVVERRRASALDLTGGGLDDLLREFTRHRADLEGRYGERIIGLASALADGANDEYIDEAGAEEIAKQKPGDDCIDFETYPWRSARDDVGRIITGSFDAAEFCADGTPPPVDELMTALQAIQVNMADGIGKLRYEAARWAIASASFGCPCYALQWLWRRTLDPDDLYSAIPDHEKFQGDPTSEDCSSP
jgi:hypothetical protein